MKRTLKLHIPIFAMISMIATVFTAFLAYIAARRYVFKKSYFGEEAENKYGELDLNKYHFVTKPFEGGANKKFPNLVIEKKWGKAVKITYYVKDENGNKLVKTWQKNRKKP